MNLAAEESLLFWQTAEERLAVSKMNKQNAFMAMLYLSGNRFITRSFVNFICSAMKVQNYSLYCEPFITFVCKYLVKPIDKIRKKLQN